jgi:6-phosphogluconolactonase
MGFPFNTIFRRALPALLSLTLLALNPRISMADADNDSSGFVYVMTNASVGNAIRVYSRDTSGMLTPVEDVFTQGTGTGGAKDPLGSQGALAITSDGGRLIAVNATSNDISVMVQDQDGVRFQSKTSSHGTMPISVATFHGLVYVLNAGGTTPNIAGFWLTPAGRLKFIPGSLHTIPGGANSGPAQVGFSPDGSLLIVTEKNTNNIDVFGVADDGGIANVVTVPSSGKTPFGFAFARHKLVISEAAGTAASAGSSTLSSYKLTDDEAVSGVLQPVTQSLDIGQKATCWVQASRKGHFVFTTNTASDTIASFSVSKNGVLNLIAGDAGKVAAGSIPTDMALTRDGKFLYVVGAGTNSLDIFRVNGGTLTWVATESGIPTSSQGIAAR